MGGKETKRVKASPASNNIKQRTENTFFLYSSYAERGGGKQNRKTNPLQLRSPSCSECFREKSSIDNDRDPPLREIGEKSERIRENATTLNTTLVVIST